MYIDKSQIGADVFAAGTGVNAYRNGATGWEALNVGLWWRWWYKNLTFSFAILLFLGIALFNGDTILRVLFGAEVLAVVWVFSLTYVSLIDVSGFKRRLWYRLWAGVQHRWFPNVARFWWYLLILFPMWLTVWYIAFFVNKTGVQPSNNLPPEWHP